jgi:tRNA-dihydrouridine synthase B
MNAFSIGPYTIDPPLVLAPMAGVTDQPFRTLCRQLGAGLVVGEMLSANPETWDTEKSRLRRVHANECAPISVQIAGWAPEQMARAAQHEVAHGAQIVDINMGCPAKKVCNRLAGSALLSEPERVAAILESVVGAVDVPVTLKIRTGPTPETRNGVMIAELAERAGIACLSVHGRTRADAFRGHAEYATIADIKRAVSIPVLANGDIETPEQARDVLEQTRADGLMFGRAAQGNPWLFREVAQFLRDGTHRPKPGFAEVHTTLCAHIRALHAFYGAERGLKIARKHIGWYLDAHALTSDNRNALLTELNPERQLDHLTFLRKAA